MATPAFFPPADHIPEMEKKLLAWFARYRRPLPWRLDYTPYRVWISEIMLQQTQMERGVLYFRRWMEKFPDTASLADAEEDAVLKEWEGLGYYSRARNVLKAARTIMDKHGGIFPHALADIRALPGIGPYTAAAIASIAFRQDVACVDANVERVIARIFDIDTPVKKEPAKSRIAELANAVLQKGHAREHNQAMMELGALVCGKKPRCHDCPVADFCTARHLGIPGERPVPGTKTEPVHVSVATGILFAGGRIYVQKRMPDDVWGGLWEFPGGGIEAGETPEETIVREFGEETGFRVRPLQPLGIIHHSYTKYRVELHCFMLALEPDPAGCGGTLPVPVLTAASDYRWAVLPEIAMLAMPAAHRILADRIAQKGLLFPEA